MLNIPTILPKEITDKYSIDRNTFVTKNKGEINNEFEVEVGDIKQDDFLPQINEIRKPTFTRLNVGMSLIFLGLFPFWIHHRPSASFLWSSIRFFLFYLCRFSWLHNRSRCMQMRCFRPSLMLRRRYSVLFSCRDSLLVNCLTNATCSGELGEPFKNFYFFSGI